MLLLPWLRRAKETRVSGPEVLLLVLAALAGCSSSLTEQLPSWSSTFTRAQ
jgi:hypothetical protein